MKQTPDDVLAGSMHNSILNATRDTVHGFRVLPGLMLSILDADGWRRMVRPVDGQVFTHDTIAEWVLGEPWSGLAFPTWDALYAVLSRSEDGRRAMSMLKERGAPAHAAIADAPVAMTTDKSETGKLGGRGHKSSGDAPQLNRQSSTSATRIAARLKRDHPEIAEAVLRGEYPSMRAAGIAAGIVKVQTPLETLMKTWAKATDAERQSFREHIG